jgi:hypothetical protein
LADFSFKLKIPIYIEKILSDIENNGSVSIHIRRGDYLEPQFRKKFDVCTPQYYINATNYLNDFTQNFRYFIFSNDPDYVRENFSFLQNYYVVDTTMEEKSDYYDLLLMTRCKHNIIANSSYSWWGAWLNKNQHKIVITPDRWFNDMPDYVDMICPPEWIRITVD